MNWVALPSPFPEISMWGSWRGDWQYALGYNSVTQCWTVSAKRGLGPMIELGFEHKSRDAAETAIKRHYRGVVQ